jgi:hypothetical protein
MNCRELTNDLLADHAGWKLAPDERRLVAAHLDGCARCRGRRDELEGIASALRNTAPRPPAALLEELDRAVLGALPRREHRPRLWPWAAAAALLLGLTALLSIRFLQPAPESRTAIAPAAELRDEPPKEDPKPTPKPEPKPEPRPEPKPDPKPEPKPDLPAVAQPPDRAKEGPKPDLPAIAQPPERAKQEVKPVPPDPKPAPPPPPPPPPPPAPKVIVMGDVNGDGSVDIADARTLQQALILGLPLPAEADVNGDGIVDVADVRQITRAEVAAR